MPIRTASLYRGGYLLVQGGSALLVFAVLARLLDDHELGLAAAALALSVTAQSFADLGLAQLVTVEVPRARAGGSDHVPVAAAAARLFARLSVAATGVVAVAAPLMPGSGWAALAIAPAAGAAMVVTGAESLARSRGDVRRPLLYVACARLPFFAFVPLVAAEPTALVALLLFSLVSVAGAAPAARDLRAAARAAPPAPSGPLIRLAVQIGIASILVVLATRVNVIVLGAVGSLADAARFEAAFRAFQPMLYLVGAIGTATMPYAAARLAGGEAVTAIVRNGLLIALAAGAVGSAVLIGGRAPISVVLMGERDAGVEDALLFLGIALPPSLVAYYLQTALLLPAGKVRAVGVGCGLMAATSLGGTVAFGAAHGPAAAAAALAASQLVYVAVVASAAAGVSSRSSSRAAT